MTSHDVVARVRRLARTRRVGPRRHARPDGDRRAGDRRQPGDPAAHVRDRRAARATPRRSGSGSRPSPTTPRARSPRPSPPAAVTDDGDPGRPGRADRRDRPGAERGQRHQDQRRSGRTSGSARARSVELAARRVTVSRLRRARRSAGRRRRPSSTSTSTSTCSSGTYIRAIARDLGAALGVGGHLTALRRTAVGGFTLAEAATLDELEERAPDVVGLPLADAARRCLPAARGRPRRRRGCCRHGGPLAPVGIDGPYAVFDAGRRRCWRSSSERDGRARAEIVLAPA